MDDTINNRIKLVRKHFDLTMDTFGDKIGIKKSSVSLIESGKNNPSEQTLMLICKEFGVDYLWLTTGKGEMLPPSDDEVMAKFDSIMFGEKDTHKIILKTLLDMDEEKLKVFDEFIEKYIENKKAD